MTQSVSYQIVSQVEALARQKQKGASDFSDAPRKTPATVVARQSAYWSGGVVFRQTSPPPLAWNRTTASSTEQKERTPVWLIVSGFALTAYPVFRVPPITGA